MRMFSRESASSLAKLTWLGLAPFSIGSENEAREQAEKNGEGEIRTLGRVAPTSVFKTDALNHSATSPYLYSINFSGRAASLNCYNKMSGFL